MFKPLKRRIAKALLSEEYNELEQGRQMYLDLIKDVPMTSHASVFREQMKGFDPKQIDNQDDIEVLYETEDGLDSFLADTVALNNNKTLQELINVLKRNQVMHIAMETNNIEEVNFGRATINGLLLLQEEIARLAAIHAKKNEKEEEYDETELL